MRVAYVGPTPTDGDGVGFAAQNLVVGLARAGAEVHLFVPVGSTPLPPALREAGVVVHASASRWRYDRWYSRTDLMKFASGFAARVAQQRRLRRHLAAEHRRHPFDVLWQFSQIELVVGREVLRGASVVLHPETHAAGELRWLRREAHLQPGARARAVRGIVGAMLLARVRMQRRSVAHAALVVAPSAVFAGHLRRDYGIDAARLAVVPNPIARERFHNAAPPAVPDRFRVLVVSRIATRKGMDQLVELSHRVSDLADLQIDVVGGPSLWSDYRDVLARARPKTLRYLGAVEPSRIPELLRAATVLLQPSLFEPFALTVGEALACGVPVLASDEVGAVEGLDPAVVGVFRAGDPGALEAVVRRWHARWRAGDLAVPDGRAVREAERLFDVEHVGRSLRTALERACA